MVVLFGLCGGAARGHVAGVRSRIWRTLGLVFYAVRIVRIFAKLSYQLQEKNNNFNSYTHSSLWSLFPFKVSVQPKKVVKCNFYK